MSQSDFLAALARVRHDFDAIADAADADLDPYADAVETPDRAVARILHSDDQQARRAATTLRNPDGLAAAAQRETRDVVLRGLVHNPHIPDTARLTAARRSDVPLHEAFRQIRDVDLLAEFARDGDPGEAVLARERLRMLAHSGMWRAGVAAGVTVDTAAVSTDMTRGLSDDELAAVGDGETTRHVVAVTELAMRCEDDAALTQLAHQRPIAAAAAWLGGDATSLRSHHVADLSAGDDAAVAAAASAAVRALAYADADQRASELDRVVDLSGHPDLVAPLAAELHRLHDCDAVPGEVYEWLARHTSSALRIALVGNGVLDSYATLRLAVADLDWGDVAPSSDEWIAADLLAAFCEHDDVDTRRRALRETVDSPRAGEVERIRPGTIVDAARAGFAAEAAGNPAALAACDYDAADVLTDELFAAEAWPALRMLVEDARRGRVPAPLRTIATRAAGLVDADSPPSLVDLVSDAAADGDPAVVAQAVRTMEPREIDRLVVALLRSSPAPGQDLWDGIVDLVPVATVRNVLPATMSPPHAVAVALRSLGDYALAVLGDDPDAFAYLGAASATWHGTWGDLVATVRAAHTT